MKHLARRIFRETLAAIDIRAAIARSLARSGSQIHTSSGAVDLAKFDRIVAIAFGKAALAMAEGLSDALAPEFTVDGMLVAPETPQREVPHWKVFTGSHPVPTAGSFAAGRAILDCLASCDSHTLVFFLISGGGSALIEWPLDERASLSDFQQLHIALIGCGAPIQEINAVRKHFSSTKGGRLAVAAPYSRKITLAVSDVPAGEESALASGPTLPDPSTVADVVRIARQFDLEVRLPVAFREALEEGTLRETPKQGDPGFANSSFDLILTGHDLFHAAHRACEAEGFLCLCDNSTDNLPVSEAVDALLVLLGAHRKVNPGHRVAVIADGEVASPVKGKGIGGRNSAFVLECVEKIAGREITVLSAGTDGIDGNSPASGAVADGETLGRAQSLGFDPAEFAACSDAYTFFARLDDAIVTGPTGNNLRDLRILLAR